MSSAANAIVYSQMRLHLELLLMRVTTSIKALLYDKVLQKSSRSRQTQTKDGNDNNDDDDEDTTVPEISNLFTSDVESVLWGTFTLHNLTVQPLQIGVVLYLLYDVLGLAALAGMAAAS